MWGYQRGFDWEDAAAEGLAAFFLLAAILLAAVAITIVIVLVREVFEIFERRAREPSASATVLWVGLASVGTLWLLVALSGALPLTLYLAAWGTFLFVIVCEYVDVHEGHREPTHGALDELDTYLDGFAPAPASTNGKTAASVGRRE